ncbi:hypothetical protein GGX14DRAFT_407807 [Mycena pura]|uniref:Uncharacterized protein n=1 Tax=Mycena pura TaxID=153505 RepID=A0AAD6URE1_9AGAR|nr:hypothetical protein GGX14DRAFT_407807 [Mycena pura]
MKLSFTPLVAAATVIGGALAALTPAQVVTNVGIVTTTSGNLNTVLGGLSTSSSPAVVASTSQTVVTDFTTIVNALVADAAAMAATEPFDDADAQPVVNALDEFVAVHQTLLSTVLSKHSIFAQFQVTAPIVAVLSDLEDEIDTFALAMINLIPTETPSVQNDQSTLDTAVGNTITTYKESCTPSPLYPIVLPVCIPA